MVLVIVATAHEPAPTLGLRLEMPLPFFTLEPCFLVLWKYFE